MNNNDNKLTANEIFDEQCYKVAIEHGLGKTLVTGHKAAYWKQAASMAMEIQSTDLIKQIGEKHIFIEKLKQDITMQYEDEYGLKKDIEILKRQNESLSQIIKGIKKEIIELHDEHAYFQGDNWTALNRILNKYNQNKQ